MPVANENAVITPDADPPGGSLSPTTLVMNFLKSKGQPLTGANIRTVLDENARNPGYIPGLGNEAPDPLDKVAPASRTTSAAPALPEPPIPPAAAPAPTSPTPVPPPSGGLGDLGNLGALIAGGGGGGLLAYLSKFMRPGGGVAPTPTPNPTLPGPRALAPPDARLALPPPDPRAPIITPAPAGNSGVNAGTSAGAMPAPGSMESAMQKALGNHAPVAIGMPPKPPAPVPQLAPPPLQLTGPGRPGEAPVAAPGSVITPPAPDIPHVPFPPNRVPVTPVQKGALTKTLRRLPENLHLRF